MLKTCKDCGILKPKSEFYRHPMMADGTVNICKTCNKAKVRNNRNKNIDYYQWYDQTRNSTKERVERRVDYAKRNSAKMARYKIESALRYPDKTKARQVLCKAIKNGEIRRFPCRVCGSLDSEGHHDDYSKPLDVTWLCPKHHAIVEQRKKLRLPIPRTPKRKLISRALFMK
jgi:hypothetical protein